MTTHTLRPHSAQSPGRVSIKTDPLYSSQMKDDQNIHYFHFINSIGIFFSLLRLIRFIMLKPFSVFEATQYDEVTWVQLVWETDKITLWIVWYILFAMIGSLVIADQISSNQSTLRVHLLMSICKVILYKFLHIHILLTNICGSGNEYLNWYQSNLLLAISCWSEDHLLGSIADTFCIYITEWTTIYCSMQWNLILGFEWTIHIFNWRISILNQTETDRRERGDGCIEPLLRVKKTWGSVQLSEGENRVPGDRPSQHTSQAAPSPPPPSDTSPPATFLFLTVKDYGKIFSLTWSNGSVRNQTASFRCLTDRFF